LNFGSFLFFLFFIVAFKSARSSYVFGTKAEKSLSPSVSVILVVAVSFGAATSILKCLVNKALCILVVIILKNADYINYFLTKQVTSSSRFILRSATIRHLSNL